MSIFTDLADKFKKKDGQTALGRGLDIGLNALSSTGVGRTAKKVVKAVRDPSKEKEKYIKKAKGAWGFIQGTLASVAGAGITVGQELSAVGKDQETKKRIRHTTVTPKTKFERTIFGEKPIGNVAQQTYEFRKAINPKAKERPLIDYPIGIALGVADFISGGGAKKAATSAIPEIVSGLKKSEDIFPFVRRMFSGSDEAVNGVAKKLENISDPRMVEEELLRISADKTNPLKLTKEATSSIQKMREIDALANNIEIDEVNKVMNLKTVDGLTPRQAENANAWLVKNGDEIVQAFKDIKDKTGGVLKDSEVMGKTLRLIETESELIKTMPKSVQSDFVAQVNAMKLKADNELTKLFEGGVKDFNKNSIEAFSSMRTLLGRSFRILKGQAKDADPLAYASIVQRLKDAGKTLDEIEGAVDEFKKARGADAFKDPVMRDTFFRQLVKPKLTEILNEYRYINMLSSPKTHLFNIASNLGQAVLRVPVRLITGGIDKIGSALTGKAREQYMREVPEYMRAAIGGVGEAFGDAMDVLRRGGMSGRRPDMKQMETGRTGPLIYILRAMDAGDVFFRKIITKGEEAALIKRAELSGVEPNISQIQKQAASNAERAVYRSKLDPDNASGQGKFNSAMDSVASSLFHLGEKVPLVRWFVPFIQTPTQVLKQGIEFTPGLGLVNLRGNKNKAELFAKQLMGASATYALADMAFNDKITWDIPTNKTERDAFYADGRKPYSIMVNGKWIPYNRLGPAGFPIGLIANIAHKYKYGPNAATASEVEKITSVVGGMIEFFSDQSFMQGVGDILQVIQEGDDIAAVGGKTLENFSRQVIPLSALQGWIARLTDDYIWDKRQGFSGSYVDSVGAQLPGVVRKLFGIELQPREDANKQAIKRSIESTKESYRSYVENRELTQFNKAQTSKDNTEVDQIKGHVYEVNKFETREEKIQYLKDLQASDPEIYDKVYKELKSRQVDETTLNATEKRIRALGVADGGRAEYIKKMLNKLETREEKIAYIKNLQTKKLLTDEVYKQLKILLNE